MKIIMSLITLPFLLIYSFIIKPIAFRILKKDFEEKEQKIKQLYKEKRNLVQENDNLKKEIEKEQHKIKRIKSIIKHYNNFENQVLLSDNNELIFIFYVKKDSLNDWIYLCGENGTHYTNDSRIALTCYGNRLKINDFISNSNKRGYGRFLLKHIIKTAKDSGVKEVFGDLSPTDKHEFDWLIPFYESLGFKCELFENNLRGGMEGKISMIIE